MCGLVGVFGDLYQGHLKFFKQALIADYVRGKHSTGMTAVKFNGEVFNKKLALDPINFLDLQSVDSNILISNTLLMGHNRHATQGSVNAANAHPFQHGDITLMHNGTLTNKWALQQKFDAPIFGTDSELVCWLINEHGPEDIIKELIGAFALTWYDESDSSFNFIRNEDRPMAMAFSDSALVYSSEWRMMGWLMERNHLALKDFDLFVPTVGEHYKFSYAAKKITKVVEKLELYVAPKYVAPVYPMSQYNRGPHGGNATTQNTRAVPSTTDERFRFYQTNFGGSIQRGSTIFAYVEKIVTKDYHKKTHIDIEMAMVDSPYTVVKAFYIPRINCPDIEKAFVVRGTVMTCNLVGEEPYFIINPMFDIINDVEDKWYTEYEAVVCADEGLPLIEQEEAVNVLIGPDGTLLTADEYRKATAKGCVMCSTVVDVEKEIEGEQTSMIVGENTSVCEHCIESYHSTFKMGVQ